MQPNHAGSSAIISQAISCVESRSIVWPSRTTSSAMTMAGWVWMVLCVGLFEGLGPNVMIREERKSRRKRAMEQERWQKYESWKRGREE